MPDETVLVQLKWEDPDTGEFHSLSFEPPIAIGRESPQMPDQWGNQPVAHLEMPHRQVSRFHALITLVNRQLYVTDKSANGTFLNGRLIQPDAQPLSSNDTLRIGPYKITAALVRHRDTSSTELNLDYSQVEGAKSSPNANSMLIWLAGIAVLLLMGLGTWGLFRMVLERSRPQPQIDSQSFHHVPEGHDQTGVLIDF